MKPSWGRQSSSRAFGLSRLLFAWRRWSEDCRGSVAIIFSVASIALIAFVAVTIDYGRTIGLRTRLQNAVDGAVLAGASDKSGGDRATIATNYFNAAAGKDASLVTSVSFSVNSAASTVTGTVYASEPMTLGQRWAAAMNISVSATAGIGSVKVRALDVVLCVDTTGSMSNTLSAVQSNALNFQSNLTTALAAAGVPAFDQLRVRVIYYRDFGGYGIYQYYGYPGYTGVNVGDPVPLNASSFFSLPTSTTAYSSFVSGQSASGGGDLPESGLECLNEAMDSTWTQVGATLSNGKKVDEVYPVISIYTDAGAHPPGFTYSLQNPNYPSASKMPRTYAGLLAKWNSATEIDQTHKMILFYGNPDIQDDYYFGNTSGWSTVKTWPGFSNPGSLTSANLSFVSSLATGIASMYAQPTLTN